MYIKEYLYIEAMIDDCVGESTLVPVIYAARLNVCNKMLCKEII